MSSDKRQRLEAVFNQLDTNKDGILEYKELLPAIMKEFNMSEADAKKICLVSFVLQPKKQITNEFSYMSLLLTCMGFQ